MKEITDERSFLFEGEVFKRLRLDGRESIWMLNDKVLDRKTTDRLENIFLERGN